MKLRALLLALCLSAWGLRPGVALAAPPPAPAGLELAPARPSHTSRMAERIDHMLLWQVPRVGREVRRSVLPNGVVVFLREDHTLPIVNANVVVRTGSVYEPIERHGVAYLTGVVLRTGGTATLTPDQLNGRLEAISAKLETAIGTEQGSASLNVLSQDTVAGFRLLGDVLLHPRFAPDQVALARAHLHEDLRRRDDDPDGTSWREFDHLIYGDHPYGRELQWSVVRRLGRQDLVDWYRRFFHPSLEALRHPAPPHAGRPDPPREEWRRPNVTIAVSGDFHSDAMLGLIKGIFGAWKPERIVAQPLPSVADRPVPGVFLIKRPLTQSHVVVGHLSACRYSPDCLPLKIMNFILGGGSFSSRVTERIRNDAGLAYAAGTSFSIRTAEPGTFSGWLETRANATHRATHMLIQKIKRMAEGQVTLPEVEDAREAYARSFLFTFRKAADVVDRLMRLEFDNLPADYNQTWLARVRAVTAADVARVARRYLRPRDLTILVVGDRAKFDGKFTDLGPVKVIPVERVP